ncbi:MAG: hypothetical protein JRN68_10015 [Nitrososphaerota archaeon]|jgi:hypothetical protein|nr:hypothetical protein [Nitrososphaerota archaeon]
MLGRKGAIFGLTIIGVLVLSVMLPPAEAVHSMNLQAESQLDAYVQVATQGQLYVKTLASLAFSHGIDVSSANNLIVEGNSSLLMAQSSLQTGTNVSGGIAAAKAAMSDFTAASELIGRLIEENGVSSYAALSISQSSLFSINETAQLLSGYVSSSCSAQNVSNASFSADCQQAAQYISNARLQASEAENLLVKSPENSSGFSTLITKARMDLQFASGLLAQISSFTYYDRVEAYIMQNLNGEISAVNASVTAQENLLLQLNQTYSKMKSYAAAQASAADGLLSTANGINTEAGAFLSSSLNSQIGVDMSVLGEVSANLTALYSQAGSYLTGSLLQILLGNITATQSSLVAYNNSLSNLRGVIGSFSSTQLNGTSGYYLEFQAASASVNSSAQAFLVSMNNLVSTLNYLLSLPILSLVTGWLNTWLTTLNGLLSTTKADWSATSSTILAQQSVLLQLQGDVSTYSGQLPGVVATVNSTAQLVSTLSQINSSESTYVNSTVQTTLSSALLSAEATSSLAAEFSTGAQALIYSTYSAVGTQYSKLSSQESSMKSTTSETVTAVSDSVGSVSYHVSSLSSAFATAQLSLTQSVQLFEEGEIQQGTSLLAQASVQLNVAAEMSASSSTS